MEMIWSGSAHERASSSKLYHKRCNLDRPAMPLVPLGHLAACCGAQGLKEAGYTQGQNVVT
jgi:hypothetical protein